MVKIVRIQMDRLAAMLREKEINLEVTEEAAALLAELGYDPDFGARPLKRTIQRLVQDPLAVKILAGEVAPGDTVRVVPAGDTVALEVVSSG